MAELDALVTDLHAGRERFLALVADVRADLHRYAARMTGSISDGEDIVQETLAYAYYALSEVHELPPLRSWLFVIAHRRSIDFMRRYERRMGRPLEVVVDSAPADGVDPDELLARDEAVRAAMSTFLALAPAQRSCVILKDVLGHSLGEIASLLDLSIPAVKAALHRGRERLRGEGARADAGDSGPPPSASPVVLRYAALFNARDWDGVRALLADDVRLDLVSRSQRTGKRDVGGYFTNYARIGAFRLVPARLDGRCVLAVFRDRTAGAAEYFVALEVMGDRVARIHDFRYVPYILRDAALAF